MERFKTPTFFDLTRKVLKRFKYTLNFIKEPRSFTIVVYNTVRSLTKGTNTKLLRKRHHSR